MSDALDCSRCATEVNSRPPFALCLRCKDEIDKALISLKDKDEQIAKLLREIEHWKTQVIG